MPKIRIKNLDKIQKSYEISKNANKRKLGNCNYAYVCIANNDEADKYKEIYKLIHSCNEDEEVIYRKIPKRLKGIIIAAIEAVLMR